MENKNWYNATQGITSVDVTEELKISRLSLAESANQVLSEDFPKRQWPFSGGWGYSKEDAVVVELDNEGDGVAFEYSFVECRTCEELIVCRPKGEALRNIRFKLISQLMVDGDDGKYYDMLKMKICALKESDYHFLKEDYERHNRYSDDEDGLAAHLLMNEERLIFFEVECWFDITRFYGKSRASQG